MSAVAAVPGGDQDWQALIALDALSAWMDGQGLEPGPIRAARLLGGGTQNVLLRFERGGRSFVLRRPPKHLRGNSNETMRREARILAGLAGSAVPHPPLIAACGDEAVLGTAFYLMEPIEGFCPRDEMPALFRGDRSFRRALGLQMVEALAALAAVDYVGVGLADFGKLDGFLERQPGRWLGQLQGYAENPGWTGLSELPGVERIVAWLSDNCPTSFTPGLLHGDYHFGNVLFRRDAPVMAAMVDWELATLGDPMVDLGWLLSAWPEDAAGKGPVDPWDGFPSRADLIARYAELTGRDVSAADWYEVLACFKLGAILEGTHARACAGRAPKATGDYLHASTVSLFERALRKIGA